MLLDDLIRLLNLKLNVSIYIFSLNFIFTYAISSKTSPRLTEGRIYPDKKLIFEMHTNYIIKLLHCG